MNYTKNQKQPPVINTHLMELMLAFNTAQQPMTNSHHSFILLDCLWDSHLFEKPLMMWKEDIQLNNRELENKVSQLFHSHMMISFQTRDRIMYSERIKIEEGGKLEKETVIVCMKCEQA